MEKVKLFSQDSRTAGRTVTLPIIGDTEFSKEDNSIEVDEEKVEALLTQDCGIKFLTEEQLELKKAEQAAKTSEEKGNEEDETKKMLKALNEEELKGLVSAYPEEEVKNLTKKSSIIGYLAKKMTNK